MGDFGGPLPPDPQDPWPSGGWDDLSYYLWLVWDTLARAINYVWFVLVSLWQLLVVIFRKLQKFLLHIWQNYVKAAITWLATHYQKLRAWLKRTITPILKRLQKIKQWYDQHILKQQLRLLQILQTMRRFLGILRLFHVKWAIALDNTLADLQNRIEESIRIVRGVLNEIINTLAMVLDPTLLIKTNVLGASLLANLGAVKRIFGYGGNRIFTGDEVTTIDRQHSLYFASTVQTHQQALIASGPNQEDLDNRKAARQALTDEINAPLPF